MNYSTGSLQYGRDIISFKIEHVERKTLEISVNPDGSVAIKAPPGTSLEEIEMRVYKRARWIKKQLDYFRQFDPRSTKRFYVNGESHLYLGKQYRLKILKGSSNSVSLHHGMFNVTVESEKSPETIKDILNAWYAGKALQKFNERFELCWKHLEKLSMKRPALKITRMKKRWGSLSSKGILILNTDLVRAPHECIDYVITHELCHLKYHDHGPGFFRLLEKLMPNWEERKYKLEKMLV